MFCFCLQGSLLKLQAMEGEGGSPLGPSPEESPSALDSKEQKSPSSPLELHGPPRDRISTPERLMVQAGQPQSPRHKPFTSIYPGQQPLTFDGMLPPAHHHSPQRGNSEGRWGGEDRQGGSGALLQQLAVGSSPMPSPRSSSPSLRFNSDPDMAPSPPCSQQYILHRGRDRLEGSESESSSSIPFLSRHIQTLKKRIRRFEHQFEQERNYKPSQNDKYSNQEMVGVMNQLAQARKQLKELRLRQSVFDRAELTDLGARSSPAQQGAQEHMPSLEETAESLFRRLQDKRQASGLPDDLREMTQSQLVTEKIALQKCLLYYESLHGRPGSQWNPVKPLYDRYQTIKRFLCTSPPFTTIEEEDGSDEELTSCPALFGLPVPPPQRATRAAGGEEGRNRDSDPAPVSPMQEVNADHQQPAVATANLHAASRSQLLQSLRETRAEKKTRRRVLREFEDEFHRQTGRSCQKEDRTPMSEEYQEYKQLKAKLRLLEVLISKQEVINIM
ncbi:protein FAM13C-like [Antennarius striatus]|uniref:protein FAM13C-like n=1 Tax=Antennarius striatus TaxID=241820 RepID=UPI0035B3A501